MHMPLLELFTGVDCTGLDNSLQCGLTIQILSCMICDIFVGLIFFNPQHKT